MARRGKAKHPGRPARPLPGDPNDPNCMGAWLRRYLEWMQVRGYAGDTVVSHKSYLSLFVLWAEARSLTRPEQVTKPILERYQRHLFYLRKPDGKPLSFRAQLGRLVPVKQYFRWLVRQNVLLFNPASEIELPKAERRLPKDVLSAVEAEAVLAEPDVRDPHGVRDRAILEVFYSTGLRRRELVRLGVYDVDIERGTLLVRHGKGGRQRVVPIGERAGAWVRKYLDEVRPALVIEPDEGVLFVSDTGDAMGLRWLTMRVREYVARAGVTKNGGCHLFRHTMATLMLEGGADVRFVQQMLGHVDLNSTQIYTHVSIRQLQKVHALTHPGAMLRPPPEPEAEEEPTGESRGG